MASSDFVEIFLNGVSTINRNNQKVCNVEAYLTAIANIELETRRSTCQNIKSLIYCLENEWSAAISV